MHALVKYCGIKIERQLKISKRNVPSLGLTEVADKVQKNKIKKLATLLHFIQLSHHKYISSDT